MIFEVFIEYMKISVLSSVLVVIVLSVSKLVGSHYRKTWRLSVWIIISLSAVFPVGLISVLSRQRILSASTGGVTPVLERIHYNLPVGGNISFADIINASEPTALYSIINAIPHWIGIVWIAGMLIQAFWIMFWYFRFCKIVFKHAYPLNDQLTVPFLKGKGLPVFVNVYLPSSITTGILNPKIIMETGDISSEEFQVVFSHECMHYKRRDLWKKLLFQIVLVIHWYNPIMRKLPDLAGNDIELCCDESILKYYGEDYADSYAKTLGRLAIASYDSSYSSAIGFSLDQDIVMIRLKAIYENTKSIRFLGAFTCVLLVILTGYISHNIHGPTSLFEIPGFQTYYNTAIYEWYDLDAAIRQRNAEVNYGVVITEEMLRNPRYLNTDGSLNVSKMEQEQRTLQNTQEYPDIWHNFPGEYCAESGFVKPHVIYGDNYAAVYYNESFQPWFFHKGDRIQITIAFDNSFFGTTDEVFLGFIKNNQLPISDNEIYSENIISYIEAVDTSSIDFVVPETGQYSFYLLRHGNGPLCINWLKITY